MEQTTVSTQKNLNKEIPREKLTRERKQKKTGNEQRQHDIRIAYVWVPDVINITYYRTMVIRAEGTTTL